jgi:HD-GYP domain-containing protein (c-di-GMP phosphodiesterase class II)
VFAHSTNVATVAVALGARLGLDATALHDLGIGCLVENVGMSMIEANLYESSEVLTDDQFVEIAKHPLISLDLLYENMKEVPLPIRMIVYQIHERCDGSGYPRGIIGDKIHPLAKIAAVADAYVALVSPRPYRPAMLPYHAMAKMLRDVKAGLYDSQAVRALLNIASLFPVGSYVELNNTFVGKIIRANGTAYDRPIAEVWRRTNLSAAPQVVDLLKETDLKVVKPLTFLH